MSDANRKSKVILRETDDPVGALDCTVIVRHEGSDGLKASPLSKMRSCGHVC